MSTPRTTPTVEGDEVGSKKDSPKMSSTTPAPANVESKEAAIVSETPALSKGIEEISKKESSGMPSTSALTATEDGDDKKSFDVMPPPTVSSTDSSKATIKFNVQATKNEEFSNKQATINSSTGSAEASKSDNVVSKQSTDALPKSFRSDSDSSVATIKASTSKVSSAALIQKVIQETAKLSMRPPVASASSIQTEADNSAYNHHSTKDLKVHFPAGGKVKVTINVAAKTPDPSNAEIVNAETDDADRKSVSTISSTTPLLGGGESRSQELAERNRPMKVKKEAKHPTADSPVWCTISIWLSALFTCFAFLVFMAFAGVGYPVKHVPHQNDTTIAVNHLITFHDHMMVTMNDHREVMKGLTEDLLACTNLDMMLVEAFEATGKVDDGVYFRCVVEPKEIMTMMETKMSEMEGLVTNWENALKEVETKLVAEIERSRGEAEVVGKDDVGGDMDVGENNDEDGDLDASDSSDDAYYAYHKSL